MLLLYLGFWRIIAFAAEYTVVLIVAFFFRRPPKTEPEVLVGFPWISRYFFFRRFFCGVPRGNYTPS